MRGEAQVGGRLQFFFGAPDPSTVMEVVELVPSRRAVWRCVEGPDEWVGTEISFDLASVDDQTVLLFKHANWREPVEFMYHCSTKWAHFLLGLKSGLEGDAYNAYPHGIPISTWG